MAKKDWSYARSVTIKSRDPVLAKIYEWMLYQSDAEGLPFDQIAQFLHNNPEWPDKERTQATAERNMPDNYPAQSAIQWFASYPPVTAMGLAKNMAAFIRLNRVEDAKATLNKFWPQTRMTSDMQENIFRSYRQYLTNDANRRRLDYLLFRDQYSAARDLAKMMGPGFHQLAETRIALADDQKSATALLALVPSDLRNDPGLMYERLRFRRRHDEDAGALQILNNPPAASAIANKEDWWKERNILARRLIEKRAYRDAYNVASKHQQETGPEYAEAEWLSGWLALRFMRDPNTAIRHFQAMDKSVKTAMSKSRAAYWTGIAYEAAGQKQQAAQWLRQGATYPKFYYGQLAAQHLKISMSSISPRAASASSTDVSKIERSSLGRAIQMTHAADLPQTRNKLILALTETLKTGGEYKALAKMLTRMGLRSEALKVAKKAAGDNFFLQEEAYPVLESQFRGIKFDKALAHAVIRQESQFDPNAKSPAGALGLMQLMPGTAKETAQKRGWDYRQEWLTSMPQNNILLGCAYLNDVLGRFSGAYPLAAAAYNAGPRRVNEWLAEFGDPRRGEVDWIDWIELIPVSETRNYVQRVMENYIVYKEHIGV